MTHSTAHAATAAHGYVQVVPDDVEESVLTMLVHTYGLSYSWGEAIDAGETHDCIELRGPTEALERFVEVELGGGYQVLH